MALNPALHRNAMRPAEQVERLLVPQVNARLEADLEIAFRDPFQQAQHIFADAEDLVDEVHVIDAARHQLIDLRQESLNIALAKLVPEERLVAESARPRTAA